MIERCLQLYMNQRDVISTLQFQAKIEPGFTSLGPLIPHFPGIVKCIIEKLRWQEAGVGWWRQCGRNFA